MSGSREHSTVRRMRLPDNVNPLKSNTGIRCPKTPDPEALGRDRYTVSDAVISGLIRREEEKPQRCEYALCMYYDPERAYCTYIHAPADILFVCPQVLENRH